MSRKTINSVLVWWVRAYVRAGDFWISRLRLACAWERRRCQCPRFGGRVPELLDSAQNFRPTELRIRANCLVSRKRDLARNVLSRVTRRERERAHYTMAVCNHLHDSSLIWPCKSNLHTAAQYNIYGAIMRNYTRCHVLYFSHCAN